MKQKAIIVDIDGTLANIEHRRHHVEKKPPDWKAFNAAMKDDTVNEWCAKLIRAMQYQHYEIIFVTGRCEEYGGITQHFLKNSGIQTAHPYTLFMRKDDDFRKDSIIKAEIYIHDIEPNYDVIFCIDDRKQIVDMWRSLGLVCLQCAEGNF